MKLCRDLERFSKDMNNRMKHIQVIVIFFFDPSAQTVYSSIHPQCDSDVTQPRYI